MPAAVVPRELTVGPFSGRRAVATGLLTRRMLDGSTWRRLLPDVYVYAGAFDIDDHRMWCAAVALNLPDSGAIGGPSAAYLWGVDLLPRRSPVHVVVPRGRRIRKHPWVSATYFTLAARDATRLFEMPVTSEVRTAFDLGRLLPRADALAAVDAFLHRRLLRVDQLIHYVDEHPGWPGISQLREIGGLADASCASPMESRLRLLLHDAGLPRPVPQFEIRTAQRYFVARVDFAYPPWRIAIEYEGDHHRERSVFRRDVRRYNALRAEGWLVLRFTADDVLRRSTQLIEEVRRAITERTSIG
ncbi:DUF559 domain-containing protein [Solwaraspora sp. WMMD406]|uniref:DUF559 domain-containing protein n=1 Tax=Solwaraspora sp. WMMD406 TaxID=3016095 RepID=UPI00241681D5|nr:DUF559 domain-containing protein [Solwaraspora sp. WMMD406]MDG4762822.1 DUF559 domain-containing protein [Solwaraspora sp. WMMD406]